MKVFISSTYIDLIEHRKAAHDALEQLGLHVIWMETFGARPVESTKACLDEVEESDLFVGIYAHRYGYIPEDSDKSITEQEFLHAKSNGKPIFGFIVNEDHPWSPKLLEYDKKDKLESFLKEIKKQPVKFFTTPENLANNISSSVGNYLKNHSVSKPIFSEGFKPTGSTLPFQSYFFGREKELSIIADAISPDSRTWGALIDGPGGIGKTALAIRAAHLAPATLFERKIFITAKIREMTPEGEKPLVDFSHENYFSMLNELAQELGEEDIPRLAPDKRANSLRIALTGKKALVIFDNLETLSEDEHTRLFQFLSRLPEGNKAIVTSRRRTDVDARVVRLDRLNHHEALQFIDELSKTNKRLSGESQAERQKLYEITNGNPLLIKWVCGQLGRTRSAMRTLAEAYNFIDEAPKSNDPLEYIFGDLIENFTSNEINILATLVHFSEPVSTKTLALTTRIPLPTAQTTIEDLIDRAIVVGDSQAKLCYIPRLTVRFLKRSRTNIQNLQNFILQSISAIREQAFKVIVEAEDNLSEKMALLESEWPLISAAIPLLANGHYQNLQTICRLLDSFLEFSGRWTEWLNLNLQAENKALSLYDYNNAGWRVYNAGWAYYLLQQPENVLICASRAETHWRNSNGGYLEKAIVLRLKGMAYQLQGEYDLAIRSFYETLDYQTRIRPRSREVAISLNDLAEAERLAGNYQAAERDFEVALQIAREISDKEGIAIYLCNLSELAINRKNWKEAEKFAREALLTTEKIGRQELLATNYFRLAKSLVYQNRPVEGLPYCRNAVDLFTLLQHKDLLEAQEILKKIE